MDNKDTLYARWLSGELSVSELEQLKKSGELQELEAIIQATDRLEIPDLDVENAYDKFKQTNIPTTKIRNIKRGRMAWAVGVAASFLVIVLVVLLNNRRPQKMEAANGSNATFELLDGSQVVLNDGSSLSLNRQNWEAERLVQLEGEGFFEVEKGGRFIVESANGSVEVLGTQFNVNAWGTQLYVECYEGRVQVESGDERLVLNPQQSAKLTNGVLVLDSIQHDVPFWQEGISTFHAAPAYEVFEELARQFDVAIDVLPIQRPFSGRFEHDDLESALNDICRPLNLSFRLTENGQKVYILRQ